MGERKKARLSIEQLYLAAVKFGQKKYPQTAEDFAGWYIIKIIEGKCLHQPMPYAYRAYLEHTNGSDYSNRRQAVMVSTRDQDFVAPGREYSERAEIIRSELKKLHKVERSMFLLLHCYGLDKKEIAALFDVNPSLVTGFMANIEKKLGINSNPKCDQASWIKDFNFETFLES